MKLMVFTIQILNKYKMESSVILLDKIIITFLKMSLVIHKIIKFKFQIKIK
jgi:hypothetical protein